MNDFQSTSQSVDDKVLRRIFGRGRGSVLVPTDFLDLGSRGAVDVVLHRLVEKGTLRRLARGVYDYPEIHPVLGALTPSAEKIAKSIVMRDRTKLGPAVAYAANLLGLSEQVPAKVVFLTDGPSRTIQIGNMTIQLRQTTPRNMAAVGRLSGLVIQAFRYLGKEHATEERIAHLKRTIPPAERQKLVKDLKLAPAWMHPIFRALASEV